MKHKSEVNVTKFVGAKSSLAQQTVAVVVADVLRN